MLSTGTLAAMTVGMLLNAWMTSSFGQRRTFIGALCFSPRRGGRAASPNESVLIFCRIVQGAVAGCAAVSMYTIFRVFPPERRGLAMASSA